MFIYNIRHYSYSLVPQRGQPGPVVGSTALAVPPALVVIDEVVSFKQIVIDNPGMSEAWVYRQEKDLVERRLLQMVKVYDPGAGRDIKGFKIDTFLNVKVDVPKKLPGYFFNQLEVDINKARLQHKLKVMVL